MRHIRFLLFLLVALTSFLTACNPSATLPVLSPGDPSGATAGRAATVDSPQLFRIGARGHGTVNALKDVELVVHNAVVSPRNLTLHIGFQNATNRSFFITGNILQNDISLYGGGRTYKASYVEQNLTDIEPEGGFAPGGANVGDVQIPRPPGNGPFDLRIPNFEPVRFWLDDPAPEESPVVVPAGSYQVGITLTSSEQALVPIAFRVLGVAVENDGLTFQVSFVNNQRTGYRLLRGPKGGDVRLLDAEGRQFKPSSVSNSLIESIAPGQGWEPGGENQGTLSFPIPAKAAQVRLVLANYSAALLSFDSHGLARARVAAANGATAPPTPTARASEAAFAQLSALLDRQAEALLAGNTRDYLSTFAPALQAGQLQIIQRSARVPFASYSLELDPVVQLSGFASGRLERIKVRLRYTLRDIDPQNSFLHLLRLTFIKQNGDWLVSDVETEEGPPFWFVGDVVQQRSDHFLIFTRPDMASQLPGLINKTESAYRSLAAQGLTLEPRYVAFFTADEKDFAQFTSRASLLAGIALWRFEWADSHLTVNSRAFYVNGDIFARDQQRGDELQLTITHELMHLVLSPSTRPFTPPWLAEGAAVYYSGQNTPGDTGQLLQRGRLERLHLDAMTRASDLGEEGGSSELLSDEYAFSGIVYAYLVAKFGKDAVLAFYRS
ncbi:MAG: hypothetical protein ACM3JD_11135, partial [Rudaea sp.]